MPFRGRGDKARRQVSLPAGPSPKAMGEGGQDYCASPPPPSPLPPTSPEKGGSRTPLRWGGTS
ncbi:hypothetical protein E2C01_049791 [Portunus trituberculatus]|uniref:Uncharacterized protein n=1 Tax=Portunus trituberculatus TaxID=210409 RepID=A0A5B7GE39_PORTR|nr:hypothetical protein [Portunus trituberculatus]